TLAQDFQPGYNLSDIVSCTKHMLEASRPHTCKSLKSSVPRKTSVTATGHMPTELLDFHEIFDLKFIGSGASGSVFRGQWQGATVAVKLIVTTADRLHMSEAAANEAVLSCLLSHPTVVQTFSCKLLALTEPLLEYIARCTGHNTDTEAETGSLDASFASGEGFGNPLVESHNLAVIQ
ncbi:protein kinase domain-containing protein, partial [Haematococcus lacustris]